MKPKAIILTSILATSLLLGLYGCGAAGGSQIDERARQAAESGAPQLRLPVDGDTIAIIKTNKGSMSFRLLSEDAPRAVENFTVHAQNGYYNGHIFHRVINRFMIQGGDPTGTGSGGESIWGTPFEDEFTTTAFHFYGALSMANSGPNTNGSQFFVVQSGLEEIGIGDGAATAEQLEAGGWPQEAAAGYGKFGGTPHLDQRHTVFGQIFSGIEVLEEIAGTETGANDKPVVDVVIESITIGAYGQ